MSAPSAREQKSLLRAALRRVSQAISPEVRAAAAVKAVQLLCEQSAWRNARSVLLYLALRDEVDLAGCAEAARLAGKRIALPRYIPESGVYAAAELTDGPNALVSGPFGILEPPAAARLLPLNQLDLTLAPGLGFSLDGVRLGRGKGYYDRLLAEAAGLKCGVALDEQIVERIPFESHDVRMDFILTPNRWIDASASQ